MEDQLIITPPKRELIKPGWYKDMENNDYHGSNGSSSTQVKTFLKQTGAHYIYNATHKDLSETDEKNLGSAFHTLTLEPHKFDAEFAIRPKEIKQRRGKDWESFKAANTGKILLSDDQHKKATTMAARVRDHSYAGILVQDIVVESSVYWWYKPNENLDGFDYKEFVKCRPDALCPSHAAIVDLKSARDASFTGFQRSLMDYFYHVSAAMYKEGVNQNEELLEELKLFAFRWFFFIVVENFPPYELAIYRLSAEDLNLGDMLYRMAMTRLHIARNADWPGYPETIRDTELPEWAKRGHSV